MVNALYIVPNRQFCGEKLVLICLMCSLVKSVHFHVNPISTTLMLLELLSQNVLIWRWRYVREGQKSIKKCRRHWVFCLMLWVNFVLLSSDMVEWHLVIILLICPITSGNHKTLWWEDSYLIEILKWVYIVPQTWNEYKNQSTKPIKIVALFFMSHKKLLALYFHEP